MRSEKEMFDLIIGVAREDERIRGVVMNGSRANPDCPKDAYQDYDIVYYVSDVRPFYDNLQWIEENFGKPAVMQLPENMSHPLLPPDADGHFTYLMLFQDGNRIDLSVDFTARRSACAEPAIVLLDKDNVLKSNTKRDYFHIKPPQAKIFADTCNEFWWCLNNVAKGIARDELPYAMEMFNHYVRDMLNQMVEWYIGVRTDFSVTAGKMGKYFKKHLPGELYEKYAATYSDSSYGNLWASVFTACELFRLTANEVSGYFGFE